MTDEVLSPVASSHTLSNGELVDSRDISKGSTITFTYTKDLFIGNIGDWSTTIQTTALL